MTLVSFYCRCGGSLKARVPDEAAAKLRQLWVFEHVAARCAPTNAQGSANGRVLARLRERARWRRVA